MSLTTREITSHKATFAVASMLAMTALDPALFSINPVVQQLWSPLWTYVLLTGGFLTVSILVFFGARSVGPVNVVVPVFGLFSVTSSLVGV